MFLFIFKRFFAVYQFKFVSKLKSQSAYVLDVGCGNDSPIRFKKYYPQYFYDGVDKDLNYNLSQDSITLINKFYKIDLENESLNKIPDNYYNFIIISHVIEHIENGEKIISELCKKLKPEGYIYIEYPRDKSKNFPSMKGTLNFYDDETHKRFYNIEKLKRILIDSKFEILKSGVKRDFWRTSFFPIRFLLSLIKNRELVAYPFWDILGFAEYILAYKTPELIN